MAAELQWPGKQAVAARVRGLLAEPALDDDIPPPNALGWTVLIGDNLQHLIRIATRHADEFELIYLDPPYNCGYQLLAYDDSSSDVRDQEWLGSVLGTQAAYLDRRDRWLTLVYARLLVLAELLSSAGAVVASIDSCEVHHLTVLITEVFGDRGPVRSYSWPHAVQPRPAVEVPVRMNHLLICAPEERQCTLPVAVLGSTREAQLEIAAELGVHGTFETPKPQRLLRHLLREHTTRAGLVLDAYAGSGSLGVAVTEQNRADGGARQCVLIERSARALEVLTARAAALVLSPVRAPQ